MIGDTGYALYIRVRTMCLKHSYCAQAMHNMLKAVKLLNQAISQDPSFFAAYCQLASAHGQLYVAAPNEHTPARLALAEAAVQAAFRLRPDSGETHPPRADLLYNPYPDSPPPFPPFSTPPPNFPHA